MAQAVLTAERDKYLSALQAMKTERSSWDSHWMELARYMLPRSGRFTTTERNKGGKKHNNIYDNTATRSVRILGAGLLGGASSPTRPWMRLSTADYELADYEPVKLWLADVSRIMYQVWQRSNTYRMLHSSYEELGVFGTACALKVDDFDTMLHFHTQTIGEFSLATDERGMVNVFARELQMTVRQMVERFGLDNCSQAVKDRYAKGDVNVWFDVVHIIEPRTDRDPKNPSAKNMPYASVYFEPGDGKEHNKMLRVSGFKSFPVLAPRWAVMSNDVYGAPSPGMEALGDTKQLQHEQLRKAEGIDYQTKPPLQVPTSLKDHALDRLPGGVTYYDQATPHNGVRSLFEVQLDLNHLLADIVDVRERVRSSFYTDLFLMLAQGPQTPKTATEVLELHEEKLLMLGPVLERLHNELLEPLVDMTFERLLGAKGADGEPVLPPPPPELEGQELKVEFISTLAQAQKAVDTNAIDRWTANLGAIATIKPNVLDKFDEDKWAEVYADKLGVDPELIVPDERVALIRKQRAAEQQAMQQAAMLQQGAETAAKAASAKTGEKNILTDMMGARR